jgi:transposase-like protein
VDRWIFDAFIGQSGTLSPAQWTSLNAHLQSAGERVRICALLDAAGTPGLRCPRCASTQCHRHGHAHGLQRHRCTGCGRTFNVLSNTPLARLRKRDKWLGFFDCMLDSCTVRRAAIRIDVHRNTSFRWRHRMLEGVRDDRDTPLRGIVEADETYLLESQKGSRSLTRPARRRGGHAAKRGISHEHDCILVARDRAGRTFDAVTGRAPLRCAHLERCLGGRLAEDCTLVSDSHGAYALFARRAKLCHRTVNLRAGVRVDGEIHVQNVNAYHSRFKQWLGRFHGVASKYLPNYLGWRWAIDGGRINSATGFLEAIFRRRTASHT